MISDLLKSKKIKHLTMSGDDNSLEKTKKWKEFQKSKTVNVFVGQIVSGGIGINLYKTVSDKIQHMVFYECTQIFTEKEQALGRIDRVGVLANEIYYKDLIIKNTIDQKIFESNSKNKNLADIIIKNEDIL